MLGKKKLDPREQRKVRQRYTLKGTADRPRMSVFRSSKHIYVQVIDDDSGHTLAAASTVEPGLRTFEGTKTAQAEAVGRLAAERALANGIHRLVFDRNGFRYTGRVAAISKVAHEMGLLSKEGYTGAASAEPAGEQE